MMTDDNNKPNHNTTAYCAYWRTTTTINLVIIRPHIVLTDKDNNNKPSHNTTRYCVYWRTTTTINRIIIRLLWLGLFLLSSVSKHNMLAYYDWVYCCCRPSVTQYLVVLWLDNNNKPNHNTTTYCVYWRKTTTINPVITRPHIIFTDGNTICGRIMIGFIVVVVRQ
jgi:hypothetical protein